MSWGSLRKERNKLFMSYLHRLTHINYIFFCYFLWSVLPTKKACNSNWHLWSSKRKMQSYLIRDKDKSKKEEWLLTIMHSLFFFFFFFFSSCIGCNVSVRVRQIYCLQKEHFHKLPTSFDMSKVLVAWCVPTIIWMIDSQIDYWNFLHLFLIYMLVTNSRLKLC